jgi:hypothetical protein
MYQGVTPTVDPTFLKKLKEFDPTLTCEFHRGHERFMIQRKATVGPPNNIMIVDDFTGFRQPDERELAALYAADLWRHGGVTERIRKGEEYMRNYRKREDEKFKEELRDVTKDNKYWLRKTLRQANNDGKANHEFRRIEVKPRGYTVNDLRKRNTKQPGQAVTA